MTVTDLLTGADANGLCAHHPVHLHQDGTWRAWSIPVILADPAGAAAQDPRRLSRAVARGELVRIRPGVYADRAAWNDAYPMHRYLVSVLAVAASRRTREAVFCGETALALHGIALWTCPREIHVRTEHAGSAGIKRPAPMPGATHPPFAERHHLVPGCRREPGRVDHGSRPALALTLAGVSMGVEPLDLVLADAVPTLDPADAATVLDALLAGRYSGVKTAEASARPRWERDDLLRLREYCTSAAARRRLVARAEFATGLTESPGESVSRVVIRDLGFVLPQLQHPVHDPRGGLVGITDFWWQDSATVGEFDGLGKYLGRRSYSGLSPEQVIARERRREDALADQGLTVVRWLAEDLRSPARLEAKLHRVGVPRRGW